MKKQIKKEVKKTCDRCYLANHDLKKVEMHETGNKIHICKDCRVWLKGLFTFVKSKKGS